MDTYHFTIVIRDARADISGLEDKLFAAGCDDALVCSYNQAVYLEFDRVADSVEQAITTALANIREAGFVQLVVQEAGVASLAEMAERAGMTRAALSLYAKNKRGDGYFSTPVYGLASGSALYPWPEVAA